MKMKRIVCAAAAVLLIAVCAAGFAETKKSIVLEGTIAAGETVKLRAPYAGTVGLVDVQAGDKLAAGVLVAQMDKVTLYAPCDGVIGLVGAMPGDEASYIAEKYGALMYIEPAQRFTVSATTKNAYDTQETKTIHVGEYVYLRNTTDTSRIGFGVVTKVSGSSYSIDVRDSNLLSGNSVYVYRASDYSTSARIGTGTVADVSYAGITGDGTIYSILVQQGASVKRGDALVELVSDTGLNITTLGDSVAASSEAFVVSVDASAGDTVKRGQSIATLAPLSGIIITAEVSSVDIAYVSVGDAVGFRNGAMPITERVSGVVESIANVASSAGTFTVRIKATYADWMKIGMGVDVFFNE